MFKLALGMERLFHHLNEDEGSHEAYPGGALALCTQRP